MRITRSWRGNGSAMVVLLGLMAVMGCNNNSGGGSGAPSATAPTISTSALPLGDQDMPYSASLTAVGSPDVKWGLTGGALAPGLSLHESGSIQGTPSQPGTWVVTVMASSPSGNDSRSLSLVVRPKTSAVSVGTAGTKSNGDSGVYPTYGGESALSGDGRYIVFQSAASNLVAGDTNGKRDFFVQDRQTGEIIRASVGNGGTEGDNDSVAGTISENGDVIAFHSFASNLVLGDSNSGAPGGGGGDVFLYDRPKGEITRVSVASLSGAEGTCAAPPAGGVTCTSFDPAVTFDGNLVAFASTFTNLVSGDTNGAADIFLHNRTSKLTERVSVGPGGLEADGGSGNPGVSADGRYVVYESMATNLLGAGNDINGASDIFVYDRVTGNTALVSKNQGGNQGNWHSFTPSISRDGKLITFWSVADNLVANDTNAAADVFVVDWQSASPTVRRVSVSGTGTEGNGDSRIPVLTKDGRYVVFESEASNLLDGGADTNGQADVFVVDLQAAASSAIKRASVNGTGAQAVGGDSHTPSISSDGRFISFTSSATNLVDGDTNGVADVFVTQRP